MWSRSPVLRGNVAATMARLDDSAIDVADTRCGGGAGVSAGSKMVVPPVRFTYVSPLRVTR